MHQNSVLSLTVFTIVGNKLLMGMYTMYNFPLHICLYNYIIDLQYVSEIITKIANPENPHIPYRPEITEIDIDSNYRRINLEYLIHRCWAEEVDQRPTIKPILRTLNKINPFK